MTVDGQFYLKKGRVMTEEKKKGWFRTALDKYDAFCKELGIDQGSCRSCVPIVKFDENEDTKKDDSEKTNTKV